MNINDIAQIFRTAPRMGAEKDEPEGNRYIQISASLADEITRELESWIDPTVWKLPDDVIPAKLVGEYAGKAEIENELTRLSIDAQVIDCIYGVYKTTANFKTSDNREGRIRLHDGKWELFWKGQEPFIP